MKATIWLTATRTSVTSLTKKKPALGRGQRAIRLTIQIPDIAFEDAPTLDAELNIPATALAYPAAEPIEVEIWPEP